MAKQQYPNFDGWTVTHDEDRNKFTFTKDDERGKNGRLTVTIRGGVGTDAATGADPELVYERGVRDCYAEDVRVAPDDKDAAARFAKADKAVVARKVKHGLAKGFGRDYAVKRLSEAGFTFAEMGKVLGEE